MFWRKKAEPSPPEQGGLTREQALACRPVTCPLVEEEEISEELVRLCYPLSLKPWFAQIASRIGIWDPRPRTKRLELDAMGSKAWKLMDGKRSVQQIVEVMAQAYDLQPREAELSVSAFIKDLGQRGLVALHAPKEGFSPAKKTPSGGKQGKRRGRKRKA